MVLYLWCYSVGDGVGMVTMVLWRRRELCGAPGAVTGFKGVVLVL